jgi:hypothetical protein
MRLLVASLDSANYGSYFNNSNIQRDMNAAGYFANVSGDAFDNWGNFRISTAETDADGESVLTETVFFNRPEGEIWEQDLTVGNMTFRVRHGWVVNGLWGLVIERLSGVGAWYLRWNGDYGSDAASQYGEISQSATIPNVTGSVTVYAKWNNDNALDDPGGDAQVVYAVINGDLTKHQLASSSGIYGQNFIRSGDDEDGETAALDRAVSVLLSVGDVPSADFLSAVLGGLHTLPELQWDGTVTLDDGTAVPATIRVRNADTGSLISEFSAGLDGQFDISVFVEPGPYEVEFRYAGTRPMVYGPYYAA